MLSLVKYSMFEVRTGKASEAASAGTKAAARGANFECLLSRSPVTGDYIKSEAQAGRMSARLMAVVAEGARGRVYLSPTPEQEAAARSADPRWRPDVEFMQQALGFRVGNYGMTKWSDLFTSRQLVALTTFSDLVQEAVGRCRTDALAADMSDDDVGLEQGGTTARAYAEALSVYLGLGVGRSADFWCSIATWSPQPKNELVSHAFTKQAIPMTWDFAEANPLSDSGGNFTQNLSFVAKCVERLGTGVPGHAAQFDASSPPTWTGRLVSTDPPYYDNIGYADLSDFFYMWLRRALRASLPELFATLAVPKGEELVATPYRHGGKAAAESFFLTGMTRAMHHLGDRAHPALPIAIYYAFKQSDTTDEEGTSSTGWETFLQAVVDSGLGLTGTWPVRTERDSRTRGIGSNALASSIVLVCRRRGLEAPAVSRKDFLRELDRTLPTAIAEMTADPIAAIAPVDLAQACIGPGMAIFSRHKAVLEADGSPMTVHSALVHINKAIDSYFAEAEGELDADTRFCIGWFQQHGFEAGVFGEADVLARAKGTSVDGVKEAGVLDSAKGKVRLLRIKEYPADWDPTTDNRTPIWEACHQMCRALGQSEHDAGELLARMPERQDSIRQLAYRLYTLCERQGRAEEARAYNELITSWPAIVEESQKVGHVWTQTNLLGSEPSPSAPKKKGRRS